jgi:selenide, water dikinase
VERTAQVLSALPRQTHPDLLLGAEHFDDAGIYRLSDTVALVQTVDFFPPLVDDPFTFGQIAAANSLSDIYAMGGRPLTALNIVGFPDKDLPIEILQQILAGGAERVQKAGAVIVGGHSVRDAEIKYGLSVTGVVHPEHFVSNAGARPGDALVLTKPIGSGVLTSAAKKRLIPEGELAEAIAAMIDLNAAAAEAMTALGATAATDITGFGLIGHAYEVAAASGVTLELDAAAVPLFAQTLVLAAKGCLTRTHQATRTHLGNKLSAGSVDANLVNVLCDAQTSGGLLICIAADRIEALCTQLREGACKAAAVIGRVVARTDAAIILR